MKVNMESVAAIEKRLKKCEERIEVGFHFDGIIDFRSCYSYYPEQIPLLIDKLCTVKLNRFSEQNIG